MTQWIDQPRSSTLHLIPGFTVQINAVPNHTDEATRWHARALGQPVDGEWTDREAAKMEAVVVALERASALFVALNKALEAPAKEQKN